MIELMIITALIICLALSAFCNIKLHKEITELKMKNYSLEKSLKSVSELEKQQWRSE